MESYGIELSTSTFFRLSFSAVKSFEHYSFLSPFLMELCLCLMYHRRLSVRQLAEEPINCLLWEAVDRVACQEASTAPSHVEEFGHVCATRHTASACPFRTQSLLYAWKTAIAERILISRQHTWTWDPVLPLCSVFLGKSINA